MTSFPERERGSICGGIVRNARPRVVHLLCVEFRYQIRSRDPVLEVPSFVKSLHLVPFSVFWLRKTFCWLFGVPFRRLALRNTLAG